LSKAAAAVEISSCSRRRPNQRLRELRQWRQLSHGPAGRGHMVESDDRASENSQARELNDFFDSIDQLQTLIGSALRV